MGIPTADYISPTKKALREFCSFPFGIHYIVYPYFSVVTSLTLICQEFDPSKALNIHAPRPAQHGMILSGAEQIDLTNLDSQAHPRQIGYKKFQNMNLATAFGNCVALLAYWDAKS